MIASRKFEPGLYAASVDVSLQAIADRVNRRRLYYDAREYLRARVERLDLAPNRALGAIFVHIPKCGGTSVENQIGVFHGHRSAVYFRAADRAFFARAFKFTLVRNPYDRLVSGFHYLKHHATAPLDRAWVARTLGGISDFQEFAEALEDPAFARRVTAWKHFVPQWYFVCDGRGRADDGPRRPDRGLRRLRHRGRAALRGPPAERGAPRLGAPALAGLLLRPGEGGGGRALPGGLPRLRLRGIARRAAISAAGGTW